MKVATLCMVTNKRGDLRVLFFCSAWVGVALALLLLACGSVVRICVEASE